jgi:hypothetical protein
LGDWEWPLQAPRKEVPAATAATAEKMTGEELLKRRMTPRQSTWDALRAGSPSTRDHAELA